MVSKAQNSADVSIDQRLAAIFQPQVDIEPQQEPVPRGAEPDDDWFAGLLILGIVAFAGSSALRKRLEERRKMEESRSALTAATTAPLYIRENQGPTQQALPIQLLPSQMSEAIGRKLAGSKRAEVVRFLHRFDFRPELEHLLAIEERLTVATLPAQYHAALSTRLLLSGIADQSFPACDRPQVDRFGHPHQVRQKNVKNRIAAFVDRDGGLSPEEHRLFVSTLDTVSRWAARGPHRMYPDEPQRFFLRLLDVLVVVARAHGCR